MFTQNLGLVFYYSSAVTRKKNLRVKAILLILGDDVYVNEKVERTVMLVLTENV